MKHSSVLKLNSPIEFIESTKISPFISKVMITQIAMAVLLQKMLREKWLQV